MEIFKNLKKIEDRTAWKKVKNIQNINLIQNQIDKKNSSAKFLKMEYSKPIKVLWEKVVLSESVLDDLKN